MTALITPQGDILCTCGNRPDLDGFESVDPYDPTHNLYRCGRCDRVHDYDELEGESAIRRVSAYLDELDRIDAIRHQQADAVHGINDLELTRTDLRAILRAAATTKGP